MARGQQYPGKVKDAYPPNSGASGTAAITTTQAQITATETLIDYLWLQAAPGNTGTIAVGFDNGVAVGSDPELVAGQNLFVRYSDLSDFWFEASTGTQNLRYLYTTYSGTVK